MIYPQLGTYKREIATFAVKLNRSPTDPDLIWLFLSQQMLTLAQSRHWGLYRNVRLDMGAILEKERKLHDALRTFLEVCYVDLNGPMPGMSDLALLAPGVVDEVIHLIKRLGLTEHDVHDEFMGFVSRIHKNLKLPMVPAEAWDRLQPEIAAGWAPQGE